MRTCVVVAAAVVVLSFRGDPRDGLRLAAAVAQTQGSAAGAPAVTGVTPVVPGWVIPPGKEELLADLLGRGAALPGPCKWSGAEAAHTVIKSSYTCPQGEVVFELYHPTEAPKGAVPTARFGVIKQSGAAPDGLADALVALIRSRESGFEWKRIEAPPGQALRTGVVIAAVAGSLAVLAVGWLLSRRRGVAKR